MCYLKNDKTFAFNSSIASGFDDKVSVACRDPHTVLYLVFCHFCVLVLVFFLIPLSVDTIHPLSSEHLIIRSTSAISCSLLGRQRVYFEAKI